VSGDTRATRPPYNAGPNRQSRRGPLPAAEFDNGRAADGGGAAGGSFSAIPVSGQAVLMGAQAACLLIFVPDTVELAVSGPRSCCSLLERQRAAAGSLPRSSGVGGRSSTCPVAISITSLAAWLKSRGRFRWVGMERSLLVPGCLCKWLSPERISKEGLRWRAAIREPRSWKGEGALSFLNMTLAPSNS
jgi:hypothetical protein